VHKKNRQFSSVGFECNSAPQGKTRSGVGEGENSDSMVKGRKVMEVALLRHALRIPETRIMVRKDKMNRKGQRTGMGRN